MAKLVITIDNIPDNVLNDVWANAVGHSPKAINCPQTDEVNLDYPTVVKFMGNNPIIMDSVLVGAVTAKAIGIYDETYNNKKG